MSPVAPARSARVFLVGLMSVMLLGVPAADAAEPAARSLRLLVGFAPGGAADVVARLIGPPLAERLGQSVIIDNRAGAGGVLAAAALARAGSDGQTLLLSSSGPLVVSPYIMNTLGYDVARDLQAVSLAVRFTNVVVVPAGAPMQTLADYLRTARTRSGGLAFATSGVGSTGHLAGELLRQRAGVPLMHVAYRGGGPAMTDVLGGQVYSMIATISTALPHVQSGRLRALAVTSARRVAALPGVPTVDESGFAGFDATNWFAFLVSAEVPLATARPISAALVDVLSAPAVREGLAHHGMEAWPTSMAEARAWIDRESRQWARVVREAGIRAE